ncbi:uridylate kinase [Methanospirillum sp. J.3.6.1-F.2.7.3]|jgi:molybdenum storage protein|uniref:UMP kinase n=2 Tax=Methanospirillum TaxID=2202 RepID=A0A8E7EIW3_9EURY|nr:MULTISPECIES: uridylate kinase [Methanospirillum]MDX8551539.1 uridylate kinase [Methanospirillum hungatei]QVV87946.1 uridylate kinase [Methanospirillum sp. J.3.6.1-F.2.7.3]QXO95420.1 uridylate kinase [Methanospirillum hungatei]
MHERHEIFNKLQGETLVRKGLFDRYNERPLMRILPELNVIKIGGHGIIDYGRDVVLPLVDEIGALSKDHQLMIITGGGVRVRHIMDIGLDLGMPTGVLAELTSKISEQNAMMLATLLAPYKAKRIHTSDLLELPTLLGMGALPVTHGTPPYGLYEHPSERTNGGIPPHRTDTGAFLAAEVLGARSCILAKNVDGLYDKHPLKYPDAKLIPEISASELIAMDMEDLVLERKLVELMLECRNVKEVQIVNGHKPGMITRAIKGEKVGTIIRAE